MLLRKGSVMRKHKHSYKQNYNFSGYNKGRRAKNDKRLRDYKSKSQRKLGRLKKQSSRVRYL